MHHSSDGGPNVAAAIHHQGWLHRLSSLFRLIKKRANVTGVRSQGEGCCCSGHRRRSPHRQIGVLACEGESTVGVAVLEWESRGAVGGAPGERRDGPSHDHWHRGPAAGALVTAGKPPPEGLGRPRSCTDEAMPSPAIVGAGSCLQRGRRSMRHRRTQGGNGHDDGRLCIDPWNRAVATFPRFGSFFTMILNGALTVLVLIVRR